ncbi:hypothetical protein GGF46_004022 [Coemansia sp. RSA 552]|nr:hypothetical protein GGF46_004022 [Coemansia sp. RSA 552]
MEFNRPVGSWAVGAAAARLVHSRGYVWAYGTMALVGLGTLVGALATAGCPGPWLVWAEAVLCLCMVTEVSVRAAAAQQRSVFLASWWNRLDIALTALCIATLLLLARGCSPAAASEEALSSALLAVRNGAQALRLVAALRRSRRLHAARDLDVAPDPAFLAMIDADDLDRAELRLSIDEYPLGGDLGGFSSATSVQSVGPDRQPSAGQRRRPTPI